MGHTGGSIGGFGCPEQVLDGHETGLGVDARAAPASGPLGR